MGKKWVWCLLIALLIFVVATYSLYTFGGGVQYMSAKRSINNLPKEKQNQAREMLDAVNEYHYSGILMGVSKAWFRGVWVWGARGPRFFRADQYTVYSYFHMCMAELTQNLATTKPITPERTIETEIDKWGLRVKMGDFVTIARASPENGGNLGRLREAIAYNWWVFNPSIPINTQCEK